MTLWSTEMTGHSVGGIPMKDPIAFFLTWPTYGTWLPGDKRGWIEYHQGWQLPSLNLEEACQANMTEKQCLLSPADRQIVVAQIQETCDHRNWTLFAADCRSNHVHIVVGAPTIAPKKIRIDIKAWCTRRLKQHCESERKNWWADRGSIRWIWNQDSLDNVIKYVNEAQDRKELDIEGRPEAEQA